MNREEEVLELYSRDMSKSQKIKLLEDKALDLYNEMKAEQENMRPELQDRLPEALMLVKNLIRGLRSRN